MDEKYNLAEGKHDDIGVFVKTNKNGKKKVYINFLTVKESPLEFVHSKVSINVKQMKKFLEFFGDWADKNNNGYLMWDELKSSDKIYTAWNDYVKPPETTGADHMPDRETTDDMPF